MWKVWMESTKVLQPDTYITILVFHNSSDLLLIDLPGTIVPITDSIQWNVTIYIWNYKYKRKYYLFQTFSLRSENVVLLKISRR